jgi:hypothetical protein
MGFRFRKSVRLMPGVRVNLGARGASLSVGRRGATMTISKRGVRQSVGIPGTGMSYSTTTPWREPERGRRRPGTVTAPADTGSNDLSARFDEVLASLDEVNLDQSMVDLDAMMAGGVKAWLVQ